MRRCRSPLPARGAACPNIPIPLPLSCRTLCQTALFIVCSPRPSYARACTATQIPACAVPTPRGEQSVAAKRRNPHKRIPRRFSALPCRPRRGRPSAQRVPREATGGASPAKQPAAASIETPPPIAAHKTRSAERWPALTEREGKFKTRNLPLVYPMSRGERSKATLRRKFPRALASAPRRAERCRTAPQPAQAHPTAIFNPSLPSPAGTAQRAARPPRSNRQRIPHRNAAANRHTQDALCRALVRSCRAGRKI